MDAAQVATLIFAGIAGLGGIGAVVALFRLGPERKKLEADAATVVSGAAVTLLKPLQDEVARLQAQYMDALKVLTALRAEVAACQGQVVALSTALEEARQKLSDAGLNNGNSTNLPE